MIVYPAVDILRGRCVQLKQGDETTEEAYFDSPVDAALAWASQGAKAFHIVNLDGTLGHAGGTIAVDSDTPSAFVALQAIRDAVPGQIQFAGGLRSRRAIEEAVGRGADRIVMGTAAAHDPALVEWAVQSYGSERIVVALETRGDALVTHGWAASSSEDPAVLGRRMAALGIAVALYTNVDREGLLQGPDTQGALRLADATGLRVVLSGGVRGVEDLETIPSDALRAVEGVILGQAIYTKRARIADVIAWAESVS